MKTKLKNFLCAITFRPYRYVDVNIDPNVLKELEEMAKAEGLTVNELIVKALVEAEKNNFNLETGIPVQPKKKKTNKSSKKKK